MSLSEGCRDRAVRMPRPGIDGPVRAGAAPGAEVELTLLGTVGLAVGGRDLPVPARKAAVLLARLATERGRRMGRAALAGFLWPDADDAHARSSLRQALARLRMVLGDASDAVEADGSVVALAPAIGVDVLALARGGEAALATDWSAEFLAGLHLGEPGIDAWIEDERRRWREAGIAVGGAALAARDAAGDARGSVAVALRLLRLDPLSEPVHRSLMRAHLAMGERGRALGQFEALARALEAELGVGPQEETRDLAREARRGAPVAAVAEPAGPVPGTPDEVIRLVGVAVLRGEPAAMAWAAGRARDEGGLPAGAAGHGGDEVVAVWGATPDRGGGAAQVLGFAREAAGRGLSVGCASGLVTVAEDDRPRGAAISTARALSWLAEPGDVLVAGGLRRQAGDAAEVAAAGIPGREAWRLLSLAEGSWSVAPPFVGRRLERLQLDALLAEAAAGRGGAAVIVGEPGIGKTRLLEETCAEACRRGFEVAELGFAERGAEALRGRLARALAGDGMPDAVPPELRGAARALLEDADPPPERPLVHDAVAALLAARAARAPLALRIEDAQWADADQLALLAALAGRLGELRVAMLVAERPGGTGLAASLGAGGAARAVVQRLAALAPDEARALARARGGPASGALLERAAGNPLFLLQLVDAARAGSGELPHTVHALVQAQLDRAPMPVRRACREAAVLGARFADADLAAIFPDATRERLDASGLVRRDGPGGAFVHALVHEAVAATLPPEESRRLHARAAEHFRARDPALWAEHALLAGAGEEAARACEAAAAHLLPQNRHAAGERFVEAGLAQPASPDLRASLLFYRGSLARERGLGAEALAAYDEALAVARDPDLRVQIALRRAAQLKFEGRFEDWARALAAAGDLAEAEPVGPATRSDLEQELGDAAFQRGDAEACLRHNRAAHDVAAGAGHVLQQARALGGIGDAHYAALRLVSARRAYEDCVALALRQGLGAVANAHRHMAAYCRFWIDPGAEAREAAAEAAHRSREGGNARNEILARLNRAEMHALAGDTAVVEAELAALGGLFDRVGGGRFRRELAQLRALGAAAEGDVERTGALSREALAVHPEPYLGPAFAAMAAWAEPDRARRAALLAHGRDLLATGGLAHSWLHHHHFAVAAHLRFGEVEAAERSAEALRRAVRQEPLRFADLTVALVEAHAGGRGIDEAEAALRGAGLGLILAS